MDRLQQRRSQQLETGVKLDWTYKPYGMWEGKSQASKTSPSTCQQGPLGGEGCSQAGTAAAHSMLPTATDLIGHVNEDKDNTDWKEKDGGCSKLRCLITMLPQRMA